jgi:hypothetical protein
MNFIPTDKDQYKLLQLVSQIQSITSYYALCIVEHCNVMLNASKLAMFGGGL